jgi:D-arabinitol dehydrogenase (NADP+)
VIPVDDRQADQLRDLAPLGYDIVVDATGIPAVLAQCFEYVRPRGRVWVFGVCPPESQVTFAPYALFRKDLSIIGSFAVNRTFPESIALIRGGAINVEALISHQLPLSDFAEALQLAEHDPGRMKVQFAL